MFEGLHLEVNENDLVGVVLTVLTCLKCGCLYTSWPRVVRALYVHMLQRVSGGRPDTSGEFIQSQLQSALYRVSFAIASLAELVEVNVSLMKDVSYPVQADLPPLLALVGTTFLQTSSWALVH